MQAGVGVNDSSKVGLEGFGKLRQAAVSDGLISGGTQSVLVESSFMAFSYV